MSPAYKGQVISICPIIADVHFVHLAQKPVCQIPRKAKNFTIIINRVPVGFTERCAWTIAFNLKSPPSSSCPFTSRLLWKMTPLGFVQSFVGKRSVNFLFHSHVTVFLLFITFCIFKQRKQESYSICSGILKCHNTTSTKEKWDHFKELGVYGCKENLHSVSSCPSCLLSWPHLSL